MTTYYARKEYTYTTGDAIFSIPFSYINKDYINVYVNDELTENYTYLNSSQVQVLDTLTSGDVVVIERQTPIDERLVIFSDTSILNKDVQNLSAEQVFDVVQEIYDNTTVIEVTANTALNNSINAVNTANAATNAVNNVINSLSAYQTKANLVTSVSGSSTDSQYPSAKLFYNTCGNIESLINAL